MNIPYENRTVDFYYRDDGDGKHPLACRAHLHIHIELFYLLSGRTRALVDAKETVVEAGDILLAFPNQVHRFESLVPEQYLLFIVHPDMLPDFARVLESGAPADPCIRHADQNPTLLSLLRMMIEVEKGQSPYREQTLRGLLAAFFGQLLERVPLVEPQGEDSQAVRRIVRFCAHHFAEDLSLATLQKELHLSRYYISYLFSRKMNIRFNDYLNSLRISEACRRLRSTDDSITDIAEQVGFNTLRTFNRSFDKQMGRTPRDYRRQCRSIPEPSGTEIEKSEE